MSESVIFIGIPASGKSTFYKTHFFATHVRINLDMLKTKNREKVLMNACLTTHQPFVSDNTNITIARRQILIARAHEFQFKVVGYYFQSSVPDSLIRNTQRNGKANIPAKAIGAMAKQLERPSYAEGFDQLFYVRIADNNTFIIEEWRDEI